LTDTILTNRDSPHSELVIDVASRIRALILFERLPEGYHLSARKLAERFDVSRAPVEQALQLLREEGAVTHIANRGCFVGEKAGSYALTEPQGESTHLRRTYFRLADDRLSGKLPDQVSESYLRKTYELSDSELRALFNRIVREGWAERRPGYGWTFSSVLTTPRALEQNYRVRLILEPAALLEPEYYLPPDKAELLRRNEEELLSGSVDGMSPDLLYERGVQFHITLAQGCQNTFLVDCLRRLHAIRRLLAYKTMVDRSRYYHQAEEHLKILEFVMAKRNDEASEALRRHISGVMNNLRPLVS